LRTPTVLRYAMAWSDYTDRDAPPEINCA